MPQLIQRLGTSYDTSLDNKRIILHFHTPGRIRVDAVLIDGVSCEETYYSYHALDSAGRPPNEFVQGILKTNGANARWKETSDTGADYALVAEEGAIFAKLNYRKPQPEGAAWTMTVSCFRTAQQDASEASTPKPLPLATSVKSQVEPVDITGEARNEKDKANIAAFENRWGFKPTKVVSEVIHQGQTLGNEPQKPLQNSENSMASNASSVETSPAAAQRLEAIPVPDIDPFTTLPADSVSLRELRREAKSGNAEAQYQLGYAYASNLLWSAGEQSTHNDLQADAIQARFRVINHLGDNPSTEQSKSNNANAKLQQLDEYLQAKGTPSAIRLYTAAAKQEHTGAMLQLSVIYANGFGGIATDHAKETDYLRQAADLGSIDGHFRLANALTDGTGTTKNFAEAVKHYEIAADAGILDALNNWAIVALYGGWRKDEGFAKNPVRAYVLTKLLARVINPNSPRAEAVQVMMQQAKQLLAAGDQLNAEEQIIPAFTRLQKDSAAADRLRGSPDLAHRFGPHSCAGWLSTYQELGHDPAMRPGGSDAAMEKAFGSPFAETNLDGKRHRYYGCTDGFIAFEYTPSPDLPGVIVLAQPTVVYSQWISRPGLRVAVPEQVATQAKRDVTTLDNLTDNHVAFNSRFTKAEWKAFVMNRYHLADWARLDGLDQQDFSMHVGECNGVDNAFGHDIITWIYKCSDGEIRLDVEVRALHKDNKIVAKVSG